MTQHNTYSTLCLCGVIITIGAVTSDVDDTIHLDSHATMCVIRRNALIINDFDRPVDVSGFNPKGPATKSLRTVSAALAYTYPSSGKLAILIVHQARCTHSFFDTP